MTTSQELPVALPIGPQEAVEKPFWEGLRADEVRLQHCSECDRWIWEPSWVCPECYRFDPPWEAVEPVGVVHSWIVTRHAFPASQEFAGSLPYTTALISLDNAAGRRMLGIVTGDSAVRIGTKVQGWIQPASELTGGWPVLRWGSVDLSGPHDTIASAGTDRG